jgi:hypothetical protein
MCELFGGPPLGEHRRGLFEHTDVLKKRLCWGVLSLWLLYLCTSKEKVTRAQARKLQRHRASAERF